MDSDHWRCSKSFEPASPRRTPPRRKIVRRPRLPRLNMSGYTYPANFYTGGFERVQRLNEALERQYRVIGEAADDVSEATDKYKDFLEVDDHLGKENHIDRLKSAKKKLQGALNKATYLLAELYAIGAGYHIPQQLEHMINMTTVKKFAPAESLAYLPGCNFYHSERFDHFPNLTDNQKSILRNLSFGVNRATFLQECGPAMRETPQYVAFYSHLKLKYQMWEDENVETNDHTALLNRVREILKQEPQRARTARLQEEERKRREEEEKRQQEEQRKELRRRKRQWERDLIRSECSPRLADLLISSMTSSEEEVEEVLGAEVEGDSADGDNAEEGDGPAEEWEGSAEEDWEGPAEEWDGPAEEWEGPAEEQWEGPAEEWEGPAGQWDGPAEEWEGSAEEWEGPAEEGRDSQFQGHHTYFHYTSDEDDAGAAEEGHGSQFQGHHTYFHYTSDEDAAGAEDAAAGAEDAAAGAEDAAAGAEDDAVAADFHHTDDE